MKNNLSEELHKEITAASVAAFLSRHVEHICVAVVCLFLCTPIIEMLICFIDETDRYYTLYHYPVIILNWVLPISIVLAVIVYGTLIGRAVTQKTGLLRCCLRRRAHLFFGLMVLWMLLSSIVTDTTHMWYLYDVYRNEPNILVAAYFLVFFFCAAQIRSPDKKERIVLFAVVLSIVLGIYSTVRYQLVSLGRDVSISRYSVAVFFNNNHYGYYLAVHTMLSSGLFALSEKRSFRVVGLVALAMNTAVLSMNNTFGAWLACCAAFVFQFVVVWIVRRRVDWRTPVGLGVFLLVTLLMSSRTQEILHSFVQFVDDVESVTTDPVNSNKAGSYRWIIWKLTVSKIAEQPVFGYGAEGIVEELYAATRNTRPHNEIMQHAVFYGIPAAVLYVCGVMSVFLNGYRHRATLDAPSLLCLVGAFAYFVSSLFGNTMFYTAPFFFLFLGMGYFHGRSNESAA